MLWAENRAKYFSILNRIPCLERYSRIPRFQGLRISYIFQSDRVFHPLPSHSATSNEVIIELSNIFAILVIQPIRGDTGAEPFGSLLASYWPAFLGRVMLLGMPHVYDISSDYFESSTLSRLFRVSVSSFCFAVIQIHYRKLIDIRSRSPSPHLPLNDR